MPSDPQQPIPAGDQFINDQDAADSAAEEDDDSDKPKGDKKAGRRKIKIEFIQDKSRRHITFSKRKAGESPRAAYELSTLTGTQVLLLVVSETGLVYTFTTAKLQPLVTQPEGKNLIQACLNAPHGALPSSMPVGPPLGRAGHGSGMGVGHNNVPGGLAIGGGKDEEGDGDDDGEQRSSKRRRRSSTAGNGPRATRSGSNATANTNPPASPHSPAQAVPPSLSIPTHGHPGQAPQPQIALGPSPTTASPSQQPTSPHYQHASPTGQYHPVQHGAPPGQDMYGAQQSLMPPPAGPPYGFGQPAQGAPPTHWGHGGAVQGSYGRR
ncbi:hypothetical protein DENSPDRAFT_858193 [Dentipellis sp. KUC8613]|nr:hypothetical protein DENSPDRAFT_858193 [Dentipellis sp. KUC8613]